MIQNYGNLVLLRKLCLKRENSYDKIVVMIKEIIKSIVNNTIFTNKIKIIIAIKVWNSSLKFFIHSFSFVEYIPNNENSSVSVTFPTTKSNTVTDPQNSYRFNSWTHGFMI